MTKPLVGGLLLVALAACGGGAGDAEQGSRTIRLYTSVTQDTVDAVAAVVSEEQPNSSVELFRAPTGELTARIASEVREGGLQADLLWLTDPLSMQQYESDGLLAAWTPAEVDALPQEFRTGTSWGTRILNMVIVHGADAEPAPSSWKDLTGIDGVVAIPDPGFAGSAFGALAYFASTDEYGFDYYRRLQENGAVQVQSPGDVITGVAEGQYAAGWTLDRSARDAIDDGAPVEMVWPEPGAIAIYSPIAVVAGSPNAESAQAFVNTVLSQAGQEAIASTGWQPVRQDVAWEHGGPQVSIDWSEAFDRQQELLEEYRAIFGG